MQLYKILLVDDEEEVRQSIAQKIDWQELGFTLVGEAENGEDALEKVDALMPDVIFTDISMPYMTGLELAQKLRRFYPSIKIVLFSGFDEFEYAKKAIALNVLDYILKPINKTELTAVFARLHKLLDDEINQKRNVDRLRESFAKNLPVLRQKFLVDLVHGNLQDSAVNSQMQEFGIDLLQAVRWSVFKVNIDIPTGENALSIHSEKELVTISVKQILDEKIGLFCKCTTFQYSNDICGIVAFDETKDIIDFTGILTDICREVKRLLAVEIYIGVGRTTDILAHVRDCYNEAKSALAFKSMADIGNVIYINDVEPIKKNYVKLSEKCEKEFAEMIKSGQEDCLKENAATITGEIFGAKLHDSQRQLLIIDAFSAIYNLLKKYEIDPGAIFGEDVDFFEILAKINDETEFQNWLIDVGGKVFTNLNNDRRNTTQGFVQQAKRYILDNYTDPELSLEGVCAILHISPTYFSAVFKKETGQSYIGFLTEVRMQKAVELLNTTDEKTYVIAEKVGYAEPNYFGYVFKKQLGVSPAKFRTQ